jgi:hypothetical protein
MKEPLAGNFSRSHSLKAESNDEPGQLHAFCKVIASRCSNNRPPSEGKLATEFINFFEVGLPTLDSWTELCTNMDIRVTLTSLPPGLRGHHTCFNNEWTIWLSEKERFPRAREHTLLHELREILEHIFSDLGLPTADTSSREARAEEFAVHTKMVASREMWIAFLGDAKKIQSTWWRRGTYGLIGFGAF